MLPTTGQAQQTMGASGIAHTSPVAVRRAPQLTAVVYGGRKAFRLSDGRSEAIIVPAIGRVMRYGLVGGFNLLWNAPRGVENGYGGWINWGGDKTWPAPQSLWPVHAGAGWPPDRSWDGAAHRAQVLPGGRLRTFSPVSPKLGARVIREYSFSNGEFVVAQSIEKLRGAPMMLSIWNVAQIPAPHAVFLPTNPQSAYKNNFFWFSKPKFEPGVNALSPNVLQLLPLRGEQTKSGYKIGVDAPVSAMAAMWDRTLFLIRSARPEGQYPDGPDNAGFPVEFYDSGDSNPAKHYVELELLSPLKPFRPGSRWTHTMRWSLHTLHSGDAGDPAVHAQVEALLQSPPPVTTSTQKK
jgi:hypothetical protein